MLKIDLHLHTIASGHAFNSILEYINQAKKLKMKVIGISDHGPTQLGAITNEIYFKVLRRVPEKVDGVRVLKGIEANIVGGKRLLDISDEVIERLDYVMAGFHNYSDYRNGSEKVNTETMIRAIGCGKVDIITHPFVNHEFATDMERIAKAACLEDVLLEINTSYLAEHRIKHNTFTNLKTMVGVVKKYKKKIIVNSDAHSVWELGDDQPLSRIKKQIGLTDRLIINNYPNELFSLLGLEK